MLRGPSTAKTMRVKQYNARISGSVYLTFVRHTIIMSDEADAPGTAGLASRPNENELLWRRSMATEQVSKRQLRSLRGPGILSPTDDTTKRRCGKAMSTVRPAAQSRPVSVRKRKSRLSKLRCPMHNRPMRLCQGRLGESGLVWNASRTDAGAKSPRMRPRRLIKPQRKRKLTSGVGLATRPFLAALSV